MNRRAFLELLAHGALGAAVASTFDLEKLLWVPKPMVTVPAMPSIATDVATGISIRMVKEWDIKRGDRFTIEGKFALNPVTRQPTEFLQQFEVTDVVNGVARIYPGGAWYGNG